MAATATNKRRRVQKHLREDVSFQPATARNKVYFEGEGDNRIGCVDDIKVLGWQSRNKNRKYRPDGVDPALYEGRPVNFNHPDPDKAKNPRDYEDRFGWVEQPYKQADGVYAKRFCFNPFHRLAKSFIWFANNKPDLVGFSQNAYGDVYEGEGGELVDEVTEVRSIDLVSDPATTNGLFEALKPEDKPMAAAVTDPTKVSVADKPGKGKGKGKGAAKTELREEDIQAQNDAEKKTGDTNEPPPKSVDTDRPDAVQDEEKLMEDEDEFEASEGEKEDEDTDDAVDDEPEDSLTDDSPEPKENEGDDTPSTGAGGAQMGPDLSPELIAAAGKIFGDPNLDVKKKLAKIKALLLVHHSAVGEGVIDYQPKNLEAAKIRLCKKMGRVPAVKMVLEALDTFETKDRIREKHKKADKLMKDANLPNTKEVRSKFFLAKLHEARDDREMQLMIEDRRDTYAAIAGSAKPKMAAGRVLLGGNPAEYEEQEAQRKTGKSKKQMTEAEIDENFKGFVEGAWDGVELEQEEVY